MKWEIIKKHVATRVRDLILGRYDSKTNEIILQDLISSNFQIKKRMSSFELINTYADKAYERNNKMKSHIITFIFGIIAGMYFGWLIKLLGIAFLGLQE